MASRKFALKEGGEKRLIIRTRSFSRKRRIFLNGREIGVIPNSKALKQGWSYTFKDGGELAIRQVRHYGLSKLQVTLNGKPLPDSDTDPERLLKITYRIVYLVAVANILLGGSIILERVPLDRLITAISQPNALAQLPFVGVMVLFIGFVYGVLGSFVERRSQIALGLVIAAMAADTVLLILNTPLDVIIATLIFRAYFLFVTVRGFNTLRSLEETKVPRKVKGSGFADWPQSVKLLVILSTGVILFLVEAEFSPFGQASLPIRTPQPTRLPTFMPTDPNHMLPTDIPLPPRTEIPLKASVQNIVYDPATDYAYGLDSMSPRLVSIDLKGKAAISSVDLDQIPETACWSSVNHHLYVVDHSAYLSEVDPEKASIVNHLAWREDVPGVQLGFSSADTVLNDTLVYCTADRVFVLKTFPPMRLWSVALTGDSTPVEYEGNENLCVSIDAQYLPKDMHPLHDPTGIVMNASGSDLYYPCIIGDVGTNQPEGQVLFHAHISANQIAMTGSLPVDKPSPVQTTLFFDDATQQVILNNSLVDFSHPDRNQHFDSFIIAFDRQHSRAATFTTIYDLTTHRRLKYLDPLLGRSQAYDVRQIFFGANGGLYMLRVDGHLVYVDIGACVDCWT